MPLLPADGRFLQRALTLAQAAAAFASPNPAVGCVLTLNGEVLAEGAHFYDQRDHAEIAALKQAVAAGHSTAGATAYVTLEPCAHHGRTGPCAEALVAAGITRCVVATVDPNPLVSGQGLAILRAANIIVDLAESSTAIAQAALRLNDAFAFSIQHRRPFVTLKAALSAEGTLAPAPALRSATAPVWLTGPAARAEVQALRHAHDALLTGIGTVLADDPALTDRTGLPRRRPLLRAVLDTHLRLPITARILQAPPGEVVVFAGNDASAEREAALAAAGVQIVALPTTAGGTLNLHDALAVLYAASVRSVLVEAGAAVNAALLAQDLVDRLILFQSPVSLGPGAIPFATGQPDPASWLSRLTHTTRQAFPRPDGTEDLCTTGYLHDPWVFNS